MSEPLVIHTNADGTVVGVDEYGKLYRGTPRQAGWDEAVAESHTGGADNFTRTWTVGGVIVASEDRTREDETDAVWEAEFSRFSMPKQYRTVLVQGTDGTISAQQVELTFTVYDWQEV